MRAEHGKIKGNLRVADGLDLHGMVTGTVLVAPGRRLDLRGTVCRDLVLEEGSSVHLYGTVSGDVYNRGGELLVHGRIGGTLHREGGTTVIEPDAAMGQDEHLMAHNLARLTRHNPGPGSWRSSLISLPTRAMRIWGPWWPLSPWPAMAAFSWLWWSGYSPLTATTNVP